MKKIIVRGSGDVGSAVAHALFEAGYAVFIHDTARPTATRRKMAFCDAIFDGYAIVADQFLAPTSLSWGAAGEQQSEDVGPYSRFCFPVFSKSGIEILA